MAIFDAAYATPTFSFRIRTPLVDVAHRLDELLEPFGCQNPNGGPTYELRAHPSGRVDVYIDSTLVLRSNTSAAAFDYVLWSVSTETIERASEFLVLHAGALSWRRRGIILPAPPDAGKTTLTAGLVRAGFRYLSDEAAFVDPTTAMLQPFPRPLWMDLSTINMMRGLLERLPEFLRAPRVSFHVAPTELRSGSIGSPCRIRFVIAPNYVRNAETRLEPLGRAEAVVLLARNSFNAASRGAAGIELLTRIVEGARCFRLVMGDLESAVDAVGRLAKGSDRSMHGSATT